MHEVTINGVRYIPAPPVCENPELLDFMWEFDEIGKVRIRDYLSALLTTLWDQQESFSSKRPFGNGGWEHDLYAALVAAGAVDGEMDENGYVSSFAEGALAKADAIINTLIVAMCSGNSNA